MKESRCLGRYLRIIKGDDKVLAEKIKETQKDADVIPIPVIDKEYLKKVKR